MAATPGWGSAQFLPRPLARNLVPSVYSVAAAKTAEASTVPWARVFVNVLILQMRKRRV